jgi:hypothetical protein
VPVSALAGTLALGVLAGGCSFNYQLDSMFAKDAGGDRSDITTTSAVRRTLRPAEEPAEVDLAIARAAATALLAAGDSKDASVPWENPATGARGTITPIAAAYSMEGVTCRDFLASYVRGGSESWLQGEACERSRGRWVVRRLRPWRKS